MAAHMKSPPVRNRQGIADGAAAAFTSCLGVGYMPIASGTWGSLWGVALYYLLPPAWFGWVILAGVPVLTIAGALAATRCERFWGGDPSRVVVDEVAGMLLTWAALPATPLVIWGGFFLFRAFDILKPPPARQAERLPGGWGIMVDDLFAGIYANIVLRLLILAIPGLAG